MFHRPRSLQNDKKSYAFILIGCCLALIPTIGHSATSSSATLQWAPNTENDLAGYRVYHGTIPGVYGIANNVGKNTSYQYPNLDPNKTHYFTVTAYDTSGNESLPAPEVSKTITENIIPVTFPITVSIHGDGTVTSTPSGLTCSAGTCSGIFTQGTSLTLMPSPATGSSFKGWSGSCSGPGNCVVNLTSSVSASATFSLSTAGPPASTKITVKDTEKGFIMSSPSAVPPEWKIEGIGDIDGDGKADIIWKNFSFNAVAVWLANGLTGFPGGVSSEWKIEAVGDADGDGQSDIVWRNITDGSVALWLMNGPTIRAAGFPAGMPLSWKIAGIWDVTGDGKGDLIWHESNKGMVAVWVMDGLNITTAGFIGGAPTEWRIEKVGDLNGDGRGDLVWRNTTDGRVAFWLIKGLNIAAVGFPVGVPLTWQVAGIGDVTGDGKGDIIWRESVHGTLAVWLMDGIKIKSVNYPGNASTEWELGGVGDVNGDGKADLIWKNGISDVVVLWSMD